MSRDDYIGVSTPEEDDEWENKERQLQNKLEQEAQEEAHKHFVIQEFSHLILEDGPATAYGRLSKEAQEQLRALIINEFTRRLTEANTGL